MQRGHAFALVDEADATLIDDAGVPLSLYGPLGDQSDFYHAIDAIVAALTPAHYELDNRRRVALTDAGYDAVEPCAAAGRIAETRRLAARNILDRAAASRDPGAARPHAAQARPRLHRAHDEVVIVDTLTGRMLPGRRYDDGLHQALEAKEGCPIGEETRTLASITFQSYFRRYDKLAGMTGTAGDETEEYRQIYGLDVVTIPTHRPMIRRDEQAAAPDPRRGAGRDAGRTGSRACARPAGADRHAVDRGLRRGRRHISKPRAGTARANAARAVLPC